MLIKFDKIVFLEDFYNQYQVSKHTGKDSIRLDIDIDYEELAKYSTKFFMIHSKRLQAEEKKRYWALQSVAQLIKTVAKKRNQTHENKKRYFLYLWKAQIMIKESITDMSARDDMLNQEENYMGTMTKTYHGLGKLVSNQKPTKGMRSPPAEWETTSDHWEKLYTSGTY